MMPAPWLQLSGHSIEPAHATLALRDGIMPLHSTTYTDWPALLLLMLLLLLLLRVHCTPLPVAPVQDATTGEHLQACWITEESPYTPQQDNNPCAVAPPGDWSWNGRY